MKNKKYTLTAKERKQLNCEKQKNGKSIKNSNKTISATEDISELDETTVYESAVARGKIKPLTIIVAIFMIMLVLTGVVVTILLIDEWKRPQGNPTATIYLSNGDKLDFVIFEDTAPIAAANFMFLSMKGFYNGTVIHDNQNDWLRFMGMTDYETHRSENEAYVKNFTGFDKYNYEWGQNQSAVKNIFWYRLKKDSGALNFDTENNTEGLLCFMYSYSSCLYQISAVNNPSTRINNTNRESFTVMGKYANNATLEVIRKLNFGADYPQYTTFRSPWYNPNEIITITSIKIKNYDERKWEGKNGILNNFDTYMAEINGYNSHSTRYTVLS